MNSASSPATRDSFPRRGYPLGALFVLVAVSAVLAAALAPSLRAVAADKLKWWEPLGAAGISVVVLGVIGAGAGALYYPHWRGLLVGGIAGGLIGIVAGPLALVSPRELLPAALAMFVGSIIAVAIAAVMRKRGE